MSYTNTSRALTSPQTQLKIDTENLSTYTDGNHNNIMRKPTVIVPSLYLLSFGLCLLIALFVHGSIKAGALFFAVPSFFLSIWITKILQNKVFNIEKATTNVRPTTEVDSVLYWMGLSIIGLLMSIPILASFYYLFKN